MSDAAWKTSELDAALTALLDNDGPERGGFVLPTGEIVEVVNVHQDPLNGFEMFDDDIIKHADDAVALWHTHPRETANLSVEDFQTFVSWPEYLHAIIGTDGIRWYGVKNKAVVNL